jgi:hypothetical protein
VVRPFREAMAFRSQAAHTRVAAVATGVTAGAPLVLRLMTCQRTSFSEPLGYDAHSEPARGQEGMMAIMQPIPRPQPVSPGQRTRSG